MSGRRPPHLCICGRSSRPPLCDGTPSPSPLQHLQWADVPRLRARKPWLQSEAALLEAVVGAISMA